MAIEEKLNNSSFHVNLSFIFLGFINLALLMSFGWHPNQRIKDNIWLGQHLPGFNDFFSAVPSHAM